MFISAETAQEIVEEIGEEIHENINLMDEKGVIVASTDKSRIGQAHEGARRIISEGLNELYITDEMATENTRQGINLPLVVFGKIVGVVGITGHKERVYRYGSIVCHMTEIMIENGIQKDTKRYNRRVQYRFLEEWIESPINVYTKEFMEKAKGLKINVEKKYRILVILFQEYHSLIDTVEGQRLLEEMEATIRHEMHRRGVLYLRKPEKQIVILQNQSNERIRRFAGEIQKMFSEKYQQKIVIGFDSVRDTDRLLKRKTEEAEKAAANGLTSERPILGYDELNVELLVSDINRATMKEYIDKLFGDITESKLAEYMELISVYFLMNGSLSRISDYLFIHKNTLQYKLKKLYELTGSDIRQPSGAAVFYMALECYMADK